MVLNERGVVVVFAENFKKALGRLLRSESKIE